MVGLDAHAVLDLVNRVARRASDHVAQVAGVGRSQVLDQDEGHAAVVRDVAKQLDERFHASGGGADAHDRKRRRRGRRGIGRRSLAVVMFHLQPSPIRCRTKSSRRHCMADNTGTTR